MIYGTEEEDYIVSIDPNDADYDEALVRYRGWCRGCKQMKNDLLGDNGICGDCD